MSEMAIVVSFGEFVDATLTKLNCDYYYYNYGYGWKMMKMNAMTLKSKIDWRKKMNC